MFNVLRQQSRRHASLTLQRSYSTPYIPPKALEHVRYVPPPPKPKPDSPNFYTGKATYYDQVNGVEAALGYTRNALTNLCLLPLPKFARDKLPPPSPAWVTKEALGKQFNNRLTMSRYRKFVKLLNQLDEYRRIAETAGCVQLSEAVQDILGVFEKGSKETTLQNKQRKPVKFDEFGRSYTVGRRKTSSARVWIIPVQTPKLTPLDEPSPNHPPAPSISDREDSLPLDLTPSAPLEPVSVTSTNILVNNVPLTQYFPHQSDRERVVRPFKIAGLTGAFNVFAIVRGGGLTGQSGALSLGIAKGLAAHVPDVQAILKKAKLLRRDPRMVERKKTGRPKARKAFTWVKR
ncbi:SSU ribosomal protein S9P [Abortiporus biennis]|nr:SSU ribosomal protein S9P [Abortiporus biennis]